MRTLKPVFRTLLIALFASVALGQVPKDKHPALIVYGKDFAFGVEEPAGWRADTSKVAQQYRVNIVFLPASQNAKNASAVIRVRVGGKHDENTIEDLNYDMDQYRKDYPGCQFGELSVVHPTYPTFAKLFFIPKRFYEYVAYLNPGPEVKAIFSVAMSKPGSPATEAELAAYRAVLSSVQWLISSVATKP